MDIEPSDRILEIGCGHGALVSLMCDRLETGAVTAIDRSEKMVEAALRRNHRHVASGRARFLAEDLSDAQFGFESFTKIVAFNVGVFWRSQAPELSEVKNWLAPGGGLFLFYQPPTDGFLTQSVERLKARLEEERMRVVDTLTKDVKPARVVCIHAAPA
jgi:SAM-dependent methyltransferase